MRKIRVAQLNMDWTEAVVAEIRSKAVAEQIDVLALQEPYASVRGSVAGFGMSARLIVGVKEESMGGGRGVKSTNRRHEAGQIVR